ncbi:hypothetical protein CNR22_12225 [Sphingobacteriaceae bacterium]|nr:hypothetical protein CNR22_12225 [Sphingobacteriaceae bacterium]
MKPALRITLIITLFFCLYCNIFVFFIDPMIERILIQYYPEQSADTLENVILIVISTLTAFFFCYKLILAYMAEQKKTHEMRASWAAVIRSEENYKTLINRISEGFVSVDKNLFYTYVNENVLKSTGKTHHDVVGKYIGDVYPEFMSTRTFQAMEKALIEQKYISLTDFYEPTRTWLENHIYPSYDGLSVLIKDITAKKGTQLLLEKNEKRFRALIENSEDIITMMNAEGIIIYVSPAFIRATGYEEEDIIGKSFFSFMPNENTPTSHQKLQAILQRPGKRIESSNLLRAKNGNYLLIEGTVSNLLQDENVQAIVCNFRDVTEKKKIEEQREENEIFYRNLFENLLSGFAYCELIYENTTVVDYTYIAVNKSFETITGLKNPAGKRVLELVPDLKQHQHFFNLITKVTAERTVGTSELFIDSLSICFSVSIYSPKKGFIVLLFEDITEKKKLDEQKSLFATIVTSSQDAIISRTLDGTITSWNRSAEELFGYTEAEAIGMDASEFLPLAEIDESYHTVDKLKSRENIKHFETLRIKKNGEKVFVSLTISPIFQNEVVTGASIIARDITDKKIAEEKIRYSENNLSAIIENATEAFVLMDRNLKIKAFNKKAQASPIFKFGNNEIEQGRLMIEYVNSQRKDFLYNVREKVLKGETVQYEIDYYSTPEKKIWYNITFTPVWENGETEGICVAILDITNKKLSQEQIVKSEENLRTIFDNALQAFILMDPDGTIKAFNAHAVKHLKVAYETEIKLGASILDIIDEKMKHFLRSIIRKTLSGKTFQFSRAFETDRGKLIWLDFTISPVSRGTKITGFCIVGSDITEKKTMEREREFDRKNLESLINNTSDLMWSVDQNRKLITYNKPFSELVLHSTGKPVSKDTDLLAIQHDEKIRRRFKGFYERALAGESFTEVMENDGSELSWSEISFYPIYNDHEVVGTACFLRNITERKKYEELLLKNSQEKESFIKELSQNNKDLQQFAYITSHNLRGPVASLMGLSNLLDNFKIEDPTLLQILEGIKKSTLRFDETIKDLNTILTVKDTPTVQRERLSFFTTFQKTIDQCDTLIKECGAEIVYDFSEVYEISFNKSYLDSIFLNLVTNALKYRNKAKTLKINVRTELANGKTILRFSDNGIGIDMKLHGKKVFQLYQRFHHNLEGKGLGLFLIKSQLESFGGSIEIRSEVNVGTEFIITF